MENFVAHMKSWFGEPLTWYVKGEVVPEQLTEYDKEFKEFLAPYCEPESTYEVNFTNVFVTHIPRKYSDTCVLQFTEVPEGTKGSYKVTKISLMKVNVQERIRKRNIEEFAAVFINVARTIKYTVDYGPDILMAIVAVANQVLEEQLPQ